jgi:hypothetical protein
VDLGHEERELFGATVQLAAIVELGTAVEEDILETRVTMEVDKH